MATEEQCRQALHDIAGRLAADPQAAARVNGERSLACHVRDLGICFHGRLRDGTLTDLADGDDPAAQVRLTLDSDDLLALVAGQLHFARAWATGRVRVRASIGDLLQLRKLA